MNNPTPYPGWTARLGDIGRLLGISAVAVGKNTGVTRVPLRRELTDSAIRLDAESVGGTDLHSSTTGTLERDRLLFDRQRKIQHISSC